MLPALRPPLPPAHPLVQALAQRAMVPALIQDAVANTPNPHMFQPPAALPGAPPHPLAVLAALLAARGTPTAEMPPALAPGAVDEGAGAPPPPEASPTLAGALGRRPRIR